MVSYGSQYENMSKGELIQELIDINVSLVNEINAKLTNLLGKLMNLHPHMTRFIWNCSNVKGLIIIFLAELFNWSAMFLGALSTAEERQLKSTLCLPKCMMMFWGRVKRYH